MLKLLFPALLGLLLACAPVVTGHVPYESLRQAETRLTTGPSDPAVDLVRRSLTVFTEEAVAVLPQYTAPQLIVFDADVTDAKLCGAGSITAISACGDEIFLRPSQLLSYSDPNAAAVYTTAHEVGHTIQSQAGLLYDYGTNGPFRELQSDCITGALVRSAGATGEELLRGIALLSSIGDLSTHGTATERVTYAEYGANNGVAACLSLTVYNPPL